MAELKWHDTGMREFEVGVDKGVYYPKTNGAYTTGAEAWPGLVNVDQSPSGGEPNPQYADNMKYINISSNEDYEATIETFKAPKGFQIVAEGYSEPIPGMRVAQQSRGEFGFSYRTKLGNDVDGSDFGFIIHVVYGAKANPTQKTYETMTDSTEAITASYDITTTPIEVPDAKPTAHIEFNSTVLSADQWKIVNNTLYGTADKEASLPSPTEWITLLTPTPTPPAGDDTQTPAGG